MRESISATQLFQLVIIFMLIFVGYLTVMLNYSTAFKIKNEVVSIIEKYEGLTTGDQNSIWIINKYLANSGYQAKGKCQENWYGAEDLSVGTHLKLNSNDAYYCVINRGNYFDVELFLKIDIIGLGKLGVFKVKGQTIKIENIVDEGLRP